MNDKSFQSKRAKQFTYISKVRLWFTNLLLSLTKTSISKVSRSFEITLVDFFNMAKKESFVNFQFKKDIFMRFSNKCLMALLKKLIRILMTNTPSFLSLAWRIVERGKEDPPQQCLVRATFFSFPRPSHLYSVIMFLNCPILENKIFLNNYGKL